MFDAINCLRAVRKISIIPLTITGRFDDAAKQNIANIYR
jgi:hypothetical protein